MTILSDLFSSSRTIEGGHPSESGLLKILAGVPETHAGVRVTPESSLSNSAVFSAVRLLAECISKLPLNVYRKQAQGGREKLPRHRITRLLRQEPNPEQTSNVMREQLVAHLLLWGNCYAEIVRLDRGRGRPAQLWPIHPDRVELERRERRRGDPVLIYKVTNPTTGGTRELRSRDVFHVPSFTLDGIRGIGLIDLARNAIGFGQAAEAYGARFFRNSSKPPGFLKFPGRFKDWKEASERIRNEWEVAQGGENQHRVAVFQEGMDWVSVGVDPKDAQALETRKFQVQEISRFLRIPPHLLMDLDKATFSNIEEQSREFLKYGLNPWLVRFEEEMNRKLLTEDGPNYFVKHNVDALLRGARKERFEGHAIALQNGFMNVDQVREQEDENPLPDGQGQEYRHQLNLGPAGGDPSPQQSSADEWAVQATRTLLEASCQSCLEYERSSLSKGLGRLQKDLEDSDKVSSFFDRLYGRLERVARGAFSPVAAAMSGAPGIEGLDAEQLAESWVSYSRRHVTRHLESDAPLASIEAELDSWTDRPSTFAAQVLKEPTS